MCRVYRYQIYGLTVHSNVPMPLLAECAEAASAASMLAMCSLSPMDFPVSPLSGNPSRSCSVKRCGRPARIGKHSL